MVRFDCKPLVWFVAALSLAAATAVLAQEKAYLKELDSEASHLNLDQQTQGTTEDAGSAVILSEVPSEEAVDLGEGLSREEFERALHRNLMGSYLFYKRLPREQQDRIYESYLKNPDSEKLRQAILRSVKLHRGNP